MIVCSLNNLYYVVLLAWSVAYLYMSFITPLPWDKRGILDISKERLKAAEESNEEYKQKLVTTFFNKDFFSKEMLEQTANISE